MKLPCLILCAMAGHAWAADLTVNPADTLVPGEGLTITGQNEWTTGPGAWYQTDWNANDGLESWVATGTTATVSGGMVAGTTTAAEATLARTTIAGGPDLDMGFNDFIEFRLQLPPNYTGDIALYYGVANAYHANHEEQTGFSPDRSITIPNDRIPKDGNFHTYRLDMGLEPMWRGILTDLRIHPSTVAGTPFTLDFIRIGDRPGFEYQKRVSLACPDAGEVREIANVNGVMKTHTIRSMESKRFRIIYSDVTLTEDAGAPWDDAKSRFTLRNLEEAWQVMVKRRGYREPCFATGGNSGTRFKVNMTMIHLGGTWAGVDDDDPAFRGGYGWQNTYPAATHPNNPPSWVNPHEFTHVCQFHQGGNFGGAAMGKWYEAHADYGMESTISQYPEIFGDVSGLNEQYMSYRFLYATNPFSHYRVWPVFLYLDHNPDGIIPNSKPETSLSARLWQESLPDEYIYATIDRITRADGGTGVKDIIGGLARRQAIFDYGDRKAPMQAAAANWNPDLRKLREFSALVRRPDAPTWWQIPAEIAPQAFAYTIHELVPETLNTPGRVVSVDFRGLPNPDRQADWRASLVVVDDAGNARYSALWNHGVNSVTLAANENKVFLSVAATPGEITSPVFEDTAQSYRSDPAKTRFPYEVQLTGAGIRETGGGSTAGLVQHANGGGWKASTASVAGTAYLGPNARVLDTATVSGDARVEDFAVVKGNARIEENAVVSGHAVVRGNVTVRGFAKVREYAMVSSEPWQSGVVIEGHARVGGRRNIIDDFSATDHATLKGVGYAFQNHSASGDVIIDGDGLGNARLSGGAHTGWLWDHLVPVRAAAMPALNRLFAAYDFDAAHPHSVIDKYGVTDGVLVGAPGWVASDGTRSGFLDFNGNGQRVLLSRWLNDFREFTVSANVKWTGNGTANQPVFHFGDGSTAKRLFFTPSNGSGVAALSISSGGSTYTVATGTPLPANVWTHVGITLDGTTAALYLNGTLAGSTACPVRPENLLPADTNESPAHNFIASGTGLPDFQGAIDHFQVHSAAFTGLAGVSISPPTLTLAETGDPLLLTISRHVLDASGLANALTVGYSVTGTATPGVDFTGLAASGSIVIPAGESDVVIPLGPLPDSLGEGTESFTVTLLAGTSHGVANGTAVITMPDRVPLDEDLLAWYQFDATDGLTAQDGSGNNNHATLQNGPVWTPAMRSLSFDDANDQNDFVQTPVPNGGSRTLAAWFRPESSTWNQNIWNYNAVFDSDVPGAYGAGWGVVDNKIRVMLDDTMWDTNIPINLNEWQHGILTFDATTARFYLNGILRGSFAYGQGGITTDNYTIGSKGFDGQIRNVRIYGRPVYGIEAMEIFKTDAPRRAPRGVQALPGHGTVTLGWVPADAGESSYVVRRATASGGPYATLASDITGTSFIDTTVANGTTYFYVIAAVGTGGVGPDSGEATATPSAGTGLPPPWQHQSIGNGITGVPGTAFSGGQVAVTGAGSVLRSGNNNGGSASDSFRFVSIPVIGDCTITAKVEAIGSSNAAARTGVMIRESLAAGSRHASTLLSNANLHFIRRVNPDANANQTTTATITRPWVRIIRSGTTFSSFFSPDGQSWTQIGGDQSIGMSGNGVYHVGLAVCSGSISQVSNAVFSNVTITGGFPAGLVAAAGNSEVRLNWNAVAGATGYRVKRASSPGGPYAVVSSPATNGFTDTAVTNGTTYYYVVSAHNGSNDSADSAGVFARPSSTLPGVPSGLTATDLGTGVQLSWTASANASGYRVKRALSPDGPFAVAVTTGGTSFTDTTVAADVNYFFTVAAMNGEGEESGDSQVVSVVRVLHFDPNGATAGSVTNGGTFNWVGSPWAVAPGGNLAPGNWQAGKMAVFAATDPGAPISYNVDLTNFNTGLHGNFTGIRAMAGNLTFTGNADNFYLLGPVTISADPGAAMVFQQTRSGLDLLAFNLNNQPATFHGDITINTPAIGNGGQVVVGSGHLKLGQALANYAPSSTLLEAGATLGNIGDAGKSLGLGTLVMRGSTLAASNAGSATLGNFQLRGHVTVEGSSLSVISADVRVVNNETRVFQVAATGDASGIDLLVTGKLGHHNGVAWGYATKTGPGVMKVSGTNELGNLTVNDGKMILEDAGIGILWQGGLTNNAHTEWSVTNGNSVVFDQPIQGSGLNTKTGGGTLTINSPTTCSGGTEVTGGTLVLGTAATLGTGNLMVSDGAVCKLQNPGGSIADSATVRIFGSATLDLAPGVSESVRFLTIDGGLRPPGTYTAANLPDHITGSGSLVVMEGSAPLTPAETWREFHFQTTGNLGLAADKADPDNDGFDNLLERAFGMNPRGHDTVGKPSMTSGGGVFSFTFRHSSAATDLDLAVQVSSDMLPGSWRVADSSDGSVERIDSGPEGNVYRFTASGSPQTKFFRIQVNP